MSSTTRLYHPKFSRRFIDVPESMVERHLTAGWKTTPILPTKAGQEPDDVPMGPPEAPARNASKETWVEYAVLRGADRDDAEEMSRDELRDVYAPSE